MTVFKSYVLTVSAVILLLASGASAQIGNVAFVDPDMGSVVGVINDPTMPFRTISGAICALEPISSAGNEGLVCARPGVYSLTCNQELFPIRMVDNVHVQGSGARETVIRGDGLSLWNGPFSVVSTGQLGVFLPRMPEGSREPAEVLVDFSRCKDEQVSEMFDGFTLQGGDVQIYFEQEFSPARYTVSNCVFDMLDDAMGSGIEGPDFGLLNVSVYLGENTEYVIGAPNFLGNTVIMGWHRGADSDLGSQVLAKPDAVGICDVTDPVSELVYGRGFLTDPHPNKLRGVNDFNAQNNLIRTLPSGAALAFMGLGLNDTTVLMGTRTGPTNAFDRSRVGGTSGVWESQIEASDFFPIPWVDINPTNSGGASGISQDPAFVGEYLSRTYGATNSHLATIRDWRLLPDSPLVDQGSSPDANGILRALNMATYNEPDDERSSFDFDGEGVGNIRTVASVANGGVINETDIGFDEAHTFISTAAFANDSDMVFLSPVTGPYGNCNTNVGQSTRHIITPNGGAMQRFSSMALFNGVPPVPFGIPVAGGVPLCLHPGLGEPFPVTGFPTGYDTGFLRVCLPGVPCAASVLPPNTFLSFPPEIVPTVTGYSAPFDFGLKPPHTFGELTTPVITAPPGIGVWHGMQAVFREVGTTIDRITNAQTERF